MKHIPNFKAFVEELAASLGIDLYKAGTCVRLHSEACGYLVLENLGNSRISLTNYVQVGNDWIADPRVVVYADSENGEDNHLEIGWHPMELCEFFGGWQLCADVSESGDLLVRDVDLMGEMANVIDDLITGSLRRQDWLHKGTLAQDAVIARTSEYAAPHEFFMDEPDDVPF